MSGSARVIRPMLGFGMGVFRELYGEPCHARANPRGRRQSSTAASAVVFAAGVTVTTKMTASAGVTAAETFPAAGTLRCVSAAE
jgi:hypothetical protein